jgi:phosphate transport system permease protein
MRSERIGRWLTLGAAILLMVTTVAIFLFVASKGVSLFVKDHLSLSQFLFSTHWDPGREAAEGGPQVGSLVFWAGSLAVTGMAILISAPLSIAAAAFMVEVEPAFGQRVLRPAIEVFVGIPSVVYGWVGLTVLVPLIAKVTGGVGFSLLAGALVLAIMIMPTIVTVTVDSLSALHKDLREAAYGLGSTRWQTIWRVLLPAARPGILTGIVLGMARAFGEALAVQMVIGNMRVLPKGFFQPATTLTSGITMDMGNSVLGTTWNNALWSLALLLLLITFAFIVVIRWIGKRGMAA